MPRDADNSDSTPEPSTKPSSAERALSHLERLEAPARVSRWDRPPPPHDWRWVVGGIGRALIVAGVLMFAFVAYQLWGTGIEYTQAQNELDDQFEELLAGTAAAPLPTVAPVTTQRGAPATSAGGVPPTTEAPAPTTTVAAAPLPTFEQGDAIARIEIATVGLDAKVVAGVEPDDLKKGPGHYPGTPMPGQFGNSAIAGHRTTYGQPFYRLDEVEVGDEIVLTTVQGRFVYRATGSEVVEPEASDVVATEDPDVATLTLTTCTPRYTANQRLVVYADLDLDASDPPQPAVLDYSGGPPEPAPRAATPGTSPRTTASPGSVPATTPQTTPPTTASGGSVPATTDGAPTTTLGEPTVGGIDDTSPGVTEASADAFSHGWFSDRAAWPHVVLWGLVGAGIAVGAYLLARWRRRLWLGVLVGTVPFLVALYFFFQNANRLLPAAI